MVDRAEVLMGLVRLLAADRGAGSTSERLCRAAVRLLQGRAGALSLGASGDRLVVAATSMGARRMEELQDLLGEGPSVDAVQRRERHDTVTSGVFPSHVAFESAAYGLLGDVRIVSFPVPVDGVAAVGTLTVISDPEPWPADRVSTGLTVAALLGVMLLQEESFEEMLRGSPWQRRTLVHQATGVVMAVLHLPADDALSLLRAHAFAAGTDVVSVARQLVEGGDTSWLRRRPSTDA